MDNPIVIAIVCAAIFLVVLALVGRVVSAWRDSRRLAARRAEIRSQQQLAALAQQEFDTLARRIVATSSTGAIAGFEIVRQIEAVFTDGHPSPARAVHVLKAIAADRGANAIIQLVTERVAGGKCVARGDAVIVRDTADAPPDAA